MVAVLVVVPLARSIPMVIAANAVLWFSAAAIAPVLSLLVLADIPEQAWGRRYALLNKY